MFLRFGTKLVNSNEIVTAELEIDVDYVPGMVWVFMYKNGVIERISAPVEYNTQECDEHFNSVMDVLNGEEVKE